MQRSDIPLAARVELAHAELQALAREAGADTLLVKGYATDRRLMHAGRHSTDVDVLVRPRHVARLTRALQAHGWETVSTFRTGSIFHHAQTMRHEHWGLVDIHRSFPGFEFAPEALFDELWERRTTQPVASFPCDVPQPLDQALLLVVHAARSPQNIEHDVGHLARVLAPQDWRLLEQRCEQLSASVAFAAATGRLPLYRDRPSHDLWLVLSHEGTRSQEWRARMRAATTLRAKLRIVASAPLPNIDHLRMDLGREPTAGDVLRVTLRRPVTAARDLLTGRARLRSTQDGPVENAASAVATRARADGVAPGGPGEDDDAALSPAPGRTTPAALLLAGGDDTAEAAPPRGSYLAANDVAVVDAPPAVDLVPGTAEVADVYLARVPGGAPLVLGGSAALVWRTALRVPEDRLLGDVAAAAGLDPEDVREDVQEFVSHLVTEGFLRRVT